MQPISENTHESSIVREIPACKVCGVKFLKPPQRQSEFFNNSEVPSRDRPDQGQLETLSFQQESAIPAELSDPRRLKLAGRVCLPNYHLLLLDVPKS